jgi:hypothetical protein
MTEELSFNHYLNIYLNNSDFQPIYFQKKCGYRFMHFFYKPLLTHLDIYNFMNKFKINNKNEIKLYLDNNYEKYLSINNTSLLLTLNNENIRPFYSNIEEKVVYVLYYDDCDLHNH